MDMQMLLSILICASLGTSIVVQILTAMLLRELFQYIRSSNSTVHERLNFVLGEINGIKDVATAIHRRLSELFTQMTRYECPGEKDRKGAA